MKELALKKKDEFQEVLMQTQFLSKNGMQNSSKF
jgi:hypothetical protein